MLWANLSSNSPLRGNSTFNFTLQIQWPLSSNPCYILAFGNVYSKYHSFFGPNCVQWGDPTECAFLFPEPSLRNCTQSADSLSDSMGYLYAQEEYDYVQTYWPVVYGRNRVSAITNSSYFVVATCGLCYAPTVDVKTPQTCFQGLNCDPLYNVLTNYRSVPLKLTSFSINNCDCLHRMNFNWSFEYYNASSAQWINFTETLRQFYISSYGNDSLFWSSFNAYNLRSVTVPNHTMAYGLYQICLNITMTDLPGTVNTAYVIQKHVYLSCKKSDNCFKFDKTNIN